MSDPQNKKNKSIFLVFIFAALSALGILMSRHHMYVNSLSPLLSEIYESETSTTALGLTPVLERHLKIGASREEIISYLQKMGFSIEQITDDKSNNSSTFDEKFVASYYLDTGWLNFFFPTEIRIILEFKDSRLEKLTGFSFKQAI
ncbi:hypothetical protein [Sinorhizobium medicae]